MIDVQEIIHLHSSMVHRWHEGEIFNPWAGLLEIVCQQHSFNFRLWHEEDEARCPEADDSRIAQVKRNIDGLNQQRNDWIEKIDEALAELLALRCVRPADAARVNTETCGSVIDRLSIMSLRIYHLNEQLARTDVTHDHVLSVQARLTTCMIQHHELAGALQQLLDDIGGGLVRHRAWRQFKMYNDPSLNPWLYGNGRKGPDDQKRAA